MAEGWLLSRAKPLEGVMEASDLKKALGRAGSGAGTSCEILFRSRWHDGGH